MKEGVDVLVSPSLTVRTVPVDVTPAAWKKDFSSELNSCALVDVNPAVVVVVVEVLLYVHKNRRLIRDGNPGRPPRLSPSS